MKQQPFFLPKEWAIQGLPPIYRRVESVQSDTTKVVERAIDEVQENLTHEQAQINLVISVISHYVQRQQLWWQAPFEIEQESWAEKKFQDLAQKWRKETKHISSLTKAILHPAYQRIIGMGPVAIKFILRELEERPHHWFWALESITGDNPVQPEDDFDGAVKAW